MRILLFCSSMEQDSSSDSSVKPCPVEVDDHLRVLKGREQALRKDYDKCISWRVRVRSICKLRYGVVFHWLYAIGGSVEYMDEAVHSASCRCRDWFCG